MDKGTPITRAARPFRRSPAQAVVLAVALAGLAATGQAQAVSPWEETSLVHVSVGSGLSSSVVGYRSGGYNLSDGTPIAFSGWYSTEWRSLSMIYFTPVSGNSGIYWGFGTGESGPQYDIDPSLTLGYMHRVTFSPRSQLSLSVSSVLGGYLSERPCTAEYGSISGPVPVNCRLAATPMPPSETLKHLFEAPPIDQLRVSMRYRFNF